MRSKINFKGHPIHPMMVSFPIAFLIGSFIFHALSILFEKENLWTGGTYLVIAGICTGLLAAIPGTVDYFLTVPPDSSADKRISSQFLRTVRLIKEVRNMQSLM
jgi:uncharacterized membrane protein